MTSRENTKVIEGELSKHCWMSQCRNNKRLKVNNHTMIMFRFPRDESLSDFWLAICNKQFFCPFHGQMICQDHFDQSDLDIVQKDDGTSALVLKPGTIPKLNIPNISHSILQEFWQQKMDGIQPVLKSVTVEYIHKKKAFLYDECPGNEGGQSTSRKKQEHASGSQCQANKTTGGGKDSPYALFTIGEKVDTSSSPKPSTVCKNTPKKCLKRTNTSPEICTAKRPKEQHKTVTISHEVVSCNEQVLKTMADIMQSFMAYHIYIIHLQQKIVDIQEIVSNQLLENPKDYDELQKKFESFHNTFLKTLQIQSDGCAEALSNSTKVWKRMIDCFHTIKTKGLLKTFITCSNGSLTTIVKVIDAINNLKASWLRTNIPMIASTLIGDNTERKAELLNLIDEIQEKLNIVDTDIHATRQRIINIKKPAVRMMEIAQVNTHPDFIYISEELSPSQKKSPKVSKPGPSKPEIPSPCTSPESPEIINKIKTPSPPPVPRDPTPPSIIQIPTPVENPQVTTVSQIPMPQMTTQINSALPTTQMMSSIQPQIIPTIQMDAYGQQTIVYQLVQPTITYQQVTIDGVTNLVPALMQPVQPVLPQTTVPTTGSNVTVTVQTVAKTDPEQSMDPPLKVIKQESKDDEDDDVRILVKEEPPENIDD